ncbi:MAG TPA: 2-phospho-L-lactate guanylyltransferase [Mycobacteriales bacterium]|nr:2-phospho-L-lactate guanylyltransferase [Mycobacteriales bacterium]
MVAAETSWVVVVPIKELRVAKSRLAGVTDSERGDLAMAMAMDVVSAAITAQAVAAVVVVTNDLRAAAELGELGARVVADVTDSGLNDALAGAARAAGVLWPRSGVCALSSDLPCVDAATLDVALGRAAAHQRGVVPDRRGDGTTMLTARAGTDLAPRYGVASRSEHMKAGAEQLDTTGLDRLRLDVDTRDDLVAALALGVGSHTAQCAAPAPIGGAIMLPTRARGRESGR